MQRNSTKYLLSIAVILIWGVIVYKLYFMITVESTVGNVSIGNGGRSSVKSAALDTFSLQSGGVDPFFRQLTSNGNTGGNRFAKKSELKVRKVATSSFLWPIVHYIGIVSRSSGQKQSVIISINGISYILQKGDNVNGMEMVNVAADSVKMRYSNETKYFVRSGI